MYLMRTETSCSFSEIGRQLGNRDHATILHGHHKISVELTQNPKLSKQVARIRERLSQDKAL